MSNPVYINQDVINLYEQAGICPPYDVKTVGKIKSARNITIFANDKNKARGNPCFSGTFPRLSAEAMGRPAHCRNL